MRQEILELARKLWDYHRLSQKLERAGAILVLCSHDTSVAERNSTSKAGLRF